MRSLEKGGAFHAITVRLTDHYGKPGSDYFMHAKRGYYATGSSATSAAVHFVMPVTRTAAE